MSENTIVKDLYMFGKSELPKIYLQIQKQSLEGKRQRTFTTRRVTGGTTLRIPYAEHARHGCHFMNAFVLLALFRLQAGKEVSGFNFLYVIYLIVRKYIDIESIAYICM